MWNGQGSLWAGSRLSVTREGEGLTCDCLALDIGGYVWNGQGSLWAGSRLSVTREGEGLTCDYQIQRARS